MKKQLIRLFSLALVFSVASCDYYDFDAIQPIDSVPANLAITDAQSARAARAGVYDGLQSNSFDGILASYLYFSDDSDWTGTFPTRAQFDNYNVLPSNGTMATFWANWYDAINRANNIVDILPNVEDVTLSDELRNNILAEARFARAISYFHLVTGFGEVPLVLSPTRSVGEELFVAKNSVEEVYNQIVSDAEFARDNLSGESLGMNAAAANALLARVAMIRGQYPTAEVAALAAIGSDYDLTGVPYMGDELFYLKFNSTDGNSLAFFFGTDDLGGRHSIEPSAKLIDAYEDGDLRRDLSIAYNDVGTPYGIKYDDFGAATGSQKDPIMFFRAAEMVLVLAEVYARSGDFDMAEMWLNQVRTRAGLDDVELDEDNYLDAILQERFVELAMEGGHRLWDLRRTGRAESVLGDDGYEACDAVWPLPQRDIDRNPNLQQNNCCNC